MPILTGIVHVLHPDTRDIVTLSPGDTLPEWAVDIVTNPDVLRDEAEPEPEPAPAEQPEPVKTTRGRKSVKNDDTPPVSEDPRAALTAKAVELGIEIGPETTEAEIQALIEAKE
jgi:hypothetical protein